MIRAFILVAALALITPAIAAPPVTALAYRPDDKLLAAGTRDVVSLINPASGQVLLELPGQTGRVTSVAFSRSGWLAVASGEPAQSGIVRLYDIHNLEKLPTKAAAEFTAHKDAIYALAFSPDGQTLATAGYDKLIKLWNVPASAKPTPRLTLTDHSDAVYGLDFHPAGKLLASASADRAVKVWDVATGKRLYTLSDPTDWLYAVAWSPDGKHLAAAGADRSIRIWEANAEGGRLIRSVFAHGRTVTRLAYPADGRTLFSVGDDRIVKTWSTTQSGEAKPYPAQPQDVLALAVRPDGKQFAVGRYDGVLQLIDPATSIPTASPLPIKPKPPTITGNLPEQAARGQTVRVHFDGARLDSITAIRASAPGVQVKLIPTPSGTRRDADVIVSTDAPIGAVQLVATSAAGDSKPIRLWVDRFPAVAEAGRTDSARTAMTVKLPATITGSLDRAGDADYFRFTATAGQQVGVQVITAADRNAFVPVLMLTDAAGQLLAEGRDGALGFICPKAGTYAIGIRDREYRGGAAHIYRLHVGSVPVVTAVAPRGVARGAETTVRVTGVNLGQADGLTVKMSPPASAAFGSKFAVPLPRTGGDPVGTAEVVISEFPSVAVAHGHAAFPALPATADGVLSKPGESHLIRFHAKKGQPLVVETRASRIGSPADTFIEVLDASNQPIERAVLRCTAKTFVTFRDHDSAKPGIRLETWNELAMDDYLYVGNELMRIRELPRNPDDDCQFYADEGRRVGFLGTTPTHHAMNTPMYKVEIHPPGSTFPPNGMPVFPVYYRNDDGGPGTGKDSRLFFTPPADGTYHVRVRDANGAGGRDFAYLLTVRPPKPDFTVRFDPTAAKVSNGGAVPLNVSVTRLDGFDGPIDVRFAGLVPPFRAPATRIDARQNAAAVALAAGDEPLPKKLPPLKVIARATIDGKEVVREAVGSAPAVVPPGDLITTTDAAELVIRPGTEAKLRVKIDRRAGHTGRVPLDVRGLPHGVRVLHIGLNGILILPNQTEREVVIYAEPWVEPTDRPFVVLARSERKGTEHAASSVILKVRR